MALYGLLGIYINVFNRKMTMMTSERIEVFFTLRGGEFEEAGRLATELKKALR